MAILAVSGHQGSGKTTLCKRLAPTLGYQYTYVGGIFREMAAKENKTIEQFYAELANDPEREKKVDAEVAKSLIYWDNQIIEGRMAPFWDACLPKINFLFTIDSVEGARRQQMRPENQALELSEMLRLSEERLVNERARYQSLYAIEDYLDPKHFHEVIDTTSLDRDDVFMETLRRLEAHGILPQRTSRR